jgi:phytol kinase
MTAPFIYILIYGLLFLIFEIIKRAKILSVDSTRSIVHTSSALIACTFPLYLSLTHIIFISCFFFIFLIISKYITLLESIHNVERKTWGEVYFPLGIAIIAWSFLPDNILNYEIAILIFGISDVLANIVGKHYGSHPLKFLGCTKTIEGSSAFFISIFAILIIFKISPLTAIFISLVTTISEFISPYGSDNLTVPIVTSILLTFT